MEPINYNDDNGIGKIICQFCKKEYSNTSTFNRHLNGNVACTNFFLSHGCSMAAGKNGQSGPRLDGHLYDGGLAGARQQHERRSYDGGRGKMGIVGRLEWSGMSWTNQADGGSFSFLNSRGVPRMMMTDGISGMGCEGLLGGMSDEDDRTSSNDKNHGTDSPSRKVLEESKGFRGAGHRAGGSCIWDSQKHRVKLMMLLQDMKAPLCAYKRIMQWASDATQDNCGIFTAQDLVHRGVALNRMAAGEGLTTNFFPKEVQCLLPMSRKAVHVVVHSMESMLASLLSDEALMAEENLLFPNDDPFSEPARMHRVVGDVVDSRAYRDGYKKYIKVKGQDVLCPIILYIDKTTLDTPGRLTLEPVYFTLGIWKRHVRNRPEAWRPLGYLTTSNKRQREGDKSTVQQPGRQNQEGMSDGAAKVQDYHAMLEVVLSDLRNLQKRGGFKWDLLHRGETMRVIFKIPIMFIVGDTEGHDRLCGHFLCRTGGVKQLCRTCECPTAECNSSKVNYRKRKAAKLEEMAAKGDLEELKAMSQHPIINAFHSLDFMSAGGRGIHGACPGEILHLIYLGIFKYVLECFYHQLGKGTNVIGPLDDLVEKIGQSLKHQSDRNMPRTHFTKLSTCKNLMGHEFSGVLIVLLLLIHTNGFRQCLLGPRRRPSTFLNLEEQLDWDSLLTSLLQWEQWLKQESISVAEVKKSALANRWLMRCIKICAPRLKGMGWNTVKFHLLTHIWEDMIMFGVPSNVDSGPGEKNHKENVKQPGGNTQKRQGQLAMQTATRYSENLLLKNLAGKYGTTKSHMAKQHMSKWNSGQKRGRRGIGGTRFSIGIRHDGNSGAGKAVYIWKTRGCMDHVKLPKRWLNALVEQCLPKLSSSHVDCFTEHKRGEHVFRAHPSYRNGSAWHDFVNVEWEVGTEGTICCIPAQICCFIDLHNLAEPIQFNDSYISEPGLYALVESMNMQEEEYEEVADERGHLPTNKVRKGTEIVKHGSKDICQETNNPQLTLVSTEAFHSPIIGIPNHGGPEHSFIFLSPGRHEWAGEWSEHIHDLYERENHETDSEVDEGEEDEDIGSNSENDSSTREESTT